jgi:hypothetical protein
LTTVLRDIQNTYAIFNLHKLPLADLYPIAILLPMSDGLKQAQRILSDAEGRLRGLIADATAAQRYDDVAKLAVLARELVLVVRSAADGEPADTRVRSAAPGNLPVQDSAVKQASLQPRPSVAAAASVGYPRFERQGDRLVKFAWSKKDRREYEHRASAEVIFRVAELFEQRCSIGTPFLMDALMPFKMPNGSDIPSYQAYLALAWFRSFAAVESRGKDGYAVAIPNLQTQVRLTWDSTPDALRR